MLSKEIDESQLIVLDIMRVRRSYITLLFKYLHYLYIVHSFNIADMSNRCILCGVGDKRIDHQDYVDWVGVCLINYYNDIQYTPQVKCADLGATRFVFKLN